MKTLKCPNCGADLTIDDQGREYAFCQFCGTKLDLTDRRTYHTEHIVNEADIERVKADKEIELEKIKRSDTKESLKDKYDHIEIIVLVVACIIALLVLE